MEGRAIARPNRRRRPVGREPTCPFNGGPSNCPAKPDRTQDTATVQIYLQWRAEQLPGQTSFDQAKVMRLLSLQWRAEQLPGQTWDGAGAAWDTSEPSMEGRAIARPNWTLVCCSPNRGSLSFNGGPSNCPAKQRRQSRSVRCRSPSMEGRAIARPNLASASKPSSGSCPSMEGRAIARPNRRRPCELWVGYGPFNGGPSNCPAKPLALSGVVDLPVRGRLRAVVEA